MPREHFFLRVRNLRGPRAAKALVFKKYLDKGGGVPIVGAEVGAPRDAEAGAGGTQERGEVERGEQRQAGGRR
jgi:hypothetical protein